jgi:hypothetical protein
MTGASRHSALEELPDLQFELFLLAREVFRVGDHQCFIGGAILPKWFFVDKDGLENWTDERPIKMRGGFRFPAAMSIVLEQCAIICATSIFPHCRWEAGWSLSSREITSSTVSCSKRFFMGILHGA